MRTFALAMVMIVSQSLALAQGGIRQVDFKNFTYPLKGYLLGHDRLQWLDTAPLKKREPIHLTDGDNLSKASSLEMDGQEYVQSEGFILQSVDFADLKGDGKEGAIVVLQYDSGGTQKTHYVYFYSFESGKPKLLAYCHTGDRAYSGLNKVYGDHGLLVFELFDPGKAEGDCCSSGVVRTRYKWNGNRFVAIGRPAHLASHAR